MVAATVVAPSLPCDRTNGRSRRLTFMASGEVPSNSSCSGDRPTQILPPMMAMVAGTAPPSRMICSTSRAISTFCGYGMPCEMMVDSSATMALPAARASSTSCENERKLFNCVMFQSC